MTPEAGRLLQSAQSHLERGRIMSGVYLNDDAVRASYLAAFHAAQAIIVERTGKVAKTHRGVQNEFFRLTKDDEPHFTPDERIFLSQAYNFKAVANESGPADLSTEQATIALKRGRDFVDAAREVLTPSDPA